MFFPFAGLKNGIFDASGIRFVFRNVFPAEAASTFVQNIVDQSGTKLKNGGTNAKNGTMSPSMHRMAGVMMHICSDLVKPAIENVEKVSVSIAFLTGRRRARGIQESKKVSGRSISFRSGIRKMVYLKQTALGRFSKMCFLHM